MIFRVNSEDECDTSCGSNSQVSRDVTAAMLVYRTIAKKVFWEFDSIIMQNLSDILPLFCTPTWPCHHVSENQELTTVNLANMQIMFGLKRTFLPRNQTSGGYPFSFRHFCTCV